MAEVDCMKARIISQGVASEIAENTGLHCEAGSVFEAWDNDQAWMDEDGRCFAYELVIEHTRRSTLGWWVHQDEVDILSHSEELSALGHPGYSDDFAEQVLLYMVENEVSASAAIVIITGKDIYARGDQ